MYPHYIPSIFPLHPQYIYSFFPECPIQPPCWLFESQGYILIYAMVTTWNHVPILVQYMVIIYRYILIWWLDHCLIISSDILIWIPTLFILYGYIYTYIYIYISIHIYIYLYIYIYIYCELYILIMDNYGITMAIFPWVFLWGGFYPPPEVPGSPPSRPPGKRPVSNCRRCSEWEKKSWNVHRKW